MCDVRPNFMNSYVNELLTTISNLNNRTVLKLKIKEGFESGGYKFEPAVDSSGTPRIH